MDREEEYRQRMEEELEEEEEAAPAQQYVPRPRWQVWLARVGLILFVLMILLYHIHIMRGGL